MSEMKFSKYNLIFQFEEDYLLVNTFSGALYNIDSDYKRIIESGIIDELDDKTISDYYKKGIIIDDDVDERRIIKYYQNKEKFCNRMLSLTVLLTMECNLGCVYCFEGSKTFHKLYLETDTMNAIYKFIQNVLEGDGGISGVSITLFGGEPLLNLKKCSSWLIQIKKMCEEMNKYFTTAIITNGVLISEKMLDILQECNCSTIQITLDGMAEIHDTRRFYKDGKGSFQDVMKGIMLANQRNDVFHLIIRINLDRSNIHDIPNLLEYLVENHLNNCDVDFGVVKAGNVENEGYSKFCFTDQEIGSIFEKLWRRMHELNFEINIKPFRPNLSCGLYSDKAFTICPDGKVYKCWEYVEDDRFHIGVLEKDGTIKKVNYHFFDWMTREFSENDACNQCTYLPICGGGCAAVSYEKNRNIHTNGCYKVKGIFETKVKLYYLMEIAKRL